MYIRSCEPNSITLRIHQGGLARLAWVIQTKSHDVVPALKKLVCDARVPVYTAIVIAREVSRHTIHILEQHEQRIRCTLRLYRVLPRRRGLDREINLLTNGEV